MNWVAREKYIWLLFSQKLLGFPHLGLLSSLWHSVSLCLGSSLIINIVPSILHFSFSNNSWPHFSPGLRDGYSQAESLHIFFCFIFLLLLHPLLISGGIRNCFSLQAMMDSPACASHPIPSFPPSSSGTLLLHRLRLHFFCSFLCLFSLGYNHTKSSLKTNLLYVGLRQLLLPKHHSSAFWKLSLPHWIPTCQSGPPINHLNCPPKSVLSDAP